MKKILIVTGSDYTDQVYEAFYDVKKQGHVFYLLSDGSFEPKLGVFEQHFKYDLRKTAEVLEYMKKQNMHFDAVTIKTSEWLTPLTALLAKHYNCIGNEPRTAFYCRSKYHMRCELASHNVPGPAFKLCRNLDEIYKAIDEIGMPCIAKPVGGNATYGTFAIFNEEDRADLKRRYDHSIEFLKKKAIDQDMFAFSKEEMDLMGIENHVDMVTDYLVEEYMIGPEISIDALVHDGKVTMTGIEEQLHLPPPYAVILAGYMPYLCDEKEYAEIQKLIEKTVSAMGIKNSPTHTEIMLTREGMKIIEIACRIGGDNLHDSVYQTSGYNLMYEAIMIALGEKREYHPTIKAHTAMQYIWPEKEGQIESIDIPKELYEDKNITEIVLSAQVGDFVYPPPKSFDVIGYITAKGITREEAKTNLKEALKRINVKIK